MFTWHRDERRHIQSALLNQSKSIRQSANDGYSGGDDFDDDDDVGSEGFHFAGGFEADDVAAAAAGAAGDGGAGAEVGEDGVFVDNFEGQGLLSAGRRVEKISVK